MKRVLNLLMAGVMALGVLGATGCVTDDDDWITCDNFDYFLYECYYNCSAGWDCEYWYNTLDVYTQDDLDYCSDCLADEADWGTCGDCSVGGYSCEVLMEEELGMVCTW